MKQNGLYLIFGCILLMSVFFVGLLAADPNYPILTVKDAVTTINDTIGIEIEADDPSNIAAVVFTITYEPEIPGDPLLGTLISCSSSFFEEFEWDADGASTIMFCGAKKIPPGSVPTTILTLNFQVSATATRDYLISLTASNIDNQVAGYPPGGEWIKVLTKADYSQLQTDISNSQGTLSIDRDDDGVTDTQEESLGMDINNKDSDDDGMDDFWEFKYKDYVDPVTRDAFEDADFDGYSNLREFIAKTDPGNNDPDVPDEPTGLLADIDLDGDVDGQDLSKLANELAEFCSGVSCDCDFDGNGQVDDIDLKLFVGDFDR